MLCVFYILFIATTADRFFRIDRAQEHLHYITDISCEDLYIMDPELQPSALQQNGTSHHTTTCYSSPNLLATTNNHPASPPRSMLSNHLDHSSSSPGIATMSAPNLVASNNHGLAPPTAVIVQDTENSDPQSGEVKFAFQFPVTPPKSPW